MVETITSARAEWREWSAGTVGADWASLCSTALASGWSTEMNESCRSRAWTNAWTMPIKTRVDMLTTGIRTPVGIKVFGARPRRRSSGSALRSRRLLATVPGTRSVLSERDGRLLPGLHRRREALARYGLGVGRRATSSESAIGGEPVTRPSRARALPRQRALHARASGATSKARARPGPVRRPGGRTCRSARSPTSGSTGPSMIRDENGLLVGYVYVDVAGRDSAATSTTPSGRRGAGRSCRAATARVERPVRLRAGAGAFEVVVPFALLILLYFSS